MKLYKLADKYGLTVDETHWEIGKTVEISPDLQRERPELCTRTVLHAYESPNLAAIMNFAHMCYVDPKCFTVEGTPVVSDGTKVGCHKLTVTGTFELPKPTATNFMAFAILCQRRLVEYREKTCGNFHPNAQFIEWSDLWLNNVGETRNTEFINDDPCKFHSIAVMQQQYAKLFPRYTTVSVGEDAFIREKICEYYEKRIRSSASDLANNFSNLSFVKFNFREYADQCMEIK